MTLKGCLYQNISNSHINDTYDNIWDNTSAKCLPVTGPAAGLGECYTKDWNFKIKEKKEQKPSGEEKTKWTCLL